MVFNRLLLLGLLTASTPVLAVDPLPEDPGPITVWLIDGSSFTGVDLIRANDQLLLKLADGTVLLLPDPLVERIRLSLTGEIPTDEIEPDPDEPQPNSHGFTLRAPQQLAGSPEPIDFVSTEEALAAIPRRGMDFPRPPIDPAWEPSSGWWQGSIFDPADRVSRWQEGVIDPSWQPTNSVGLHSDPVGFVPSLWRSSIIDPFWYPTNSFRVPLLDQ